MTPLDTTVINGFARIMNYVVNFTPFFPLPAGSHIKIIFPSYMQILTPSFFQPGGYQLHYVNYGLEDISPTNTVGIYYLNSIQNYLMFTNYKAMTMANEISIVICAKNVSN